MLILNATNKTIIAVMSGAPSTTQPSYITAYADDDGSSLVEGASNGLLNSTTPVTIIAAPASSTRRVIKQIYIQNTDTAAVTVTVKYDVAGTASILAIVTLQPGDTWSTDATFDNTGALKQKLAGFTGVLPVANGGTGASTASITSFNNITGYTASGATGTTSTNIVFSTSPTLVTPTLGAASATTINKVTLTAPASGSTLTIADGKTLTANSTLTLAGTDSKTLTVSNSLTLAGTDSTVMTFPTTSATIARTDAAQTFTGTQTFSQVITTANAITASGNAATVPVTSRHNIVTNNSAATLTITLTTASAVNMQTCVVQILDSSAAAQTISWVNTENSGTSVPTTSNGSTTLPLTVGFIYNSATSKWRCIASA